MRTPFLAPRVSARMRDGAGARLRRIDFRRRVAANAARINQRKALAHLLHLVLVLKVRAAALQNEICRRLSWHRVIRIRKDTRLEVGPAKLCRVVTDDTRRFRNDRGALWRVRASELNCLSQAVVVELIVRKEVGRVAISDHV